MSMTYSPLVQAAPSVTHDLPLLDQILSETRVQPADEGYDIARRGVAAFVYELMQPRRRNEQINNGVIDQMIADIDGRISRQIDEILHDKAFQTLESAWRGLKFVVDRTDFRQNIRLEVLNCSKADLLDDFEDSPEVVKSGLYRHIYSAEFGQFGGKPYGAVIANYTFGAGAQDVRLMQFMSSVGAISHAPMIAAAAPQMFGAETYGDIANLKDFDSIFEGPRYSRWTAFRQTEDARYFGLTLPRFLLRLPYGSEAVAVKSFQYEEKSGGSTENYLWGNAAFAFATRLTESFALYRWCPNIIGPQSGGVVDNLPVHHFESMGQLQSKVPTEVLITDRREYELAEQGFIPLTMRKGSNNAAFFSANSVQKPKFFGNSEEGRTAELNYKLGTQLSYMFMINRLAHYIKILQRENIGSWKNKAELQDELGKWIGQYVVDQDNPSPEVRARRPLRKAAIRVEDVEGEPGWYRVALSVIPHFKYMGADFTLSLTGKLDKL